LVHSILIGVCRLFFFTLLLLFWILALGDFTGNPAIKTLAGYEGIFCGFSAILSGYGGICSMRCMEGRFPSCWSGKGVET